MDTVGSPLLNMVLLIYLVVGCILYLYVIYRLFLYVRKQVLLIGQKGKKAVNWFLLSLACLYVGMFFIILLIGVVYGIRKIF